jgi:hypothetical protein
MLPYVALLSLAVVAGFIVQGNFSKLTSGVLAVAVPRHRGAPRPAIRPTPSLKEIQPISLIALLATLVLLFGFQGEQIISQPIIIALLAVPIIIQVYWASNSGYNG